MSGAKYMRIDEEDIKQQAADTKNRAVKAVFDRKTLSLTAKDTLPLGDSLDIDFEKVVNMLEDSEPCALLVRIWDKAQTVNCSITDWVVITWVPDANPSTQKELWATAGDRLNEVLIPDRSKEWRVTKKSEATLDAFVEQAKEVSTMRPPARRVSVEQARSSSVGKPSDWIWGDPGTQKVTCFQGFSIYLACVIPNLVVLLVLSDIGIGIKVYNLISPVTMSLAGDASIFFASISICTLYIADWFFFESKCIQAITGAVPVILITAGAFLKARKYPWAPLLFTLFLIPVSLGALRSTVCKRTRRTQFYVAVSMVTGSCALVMLIAWVAWMYVGGNEWSRETKDDLVARSEGVYKYIYSQQALNYTMDCHPILRDLSNYTKLERPKIKAACGKAVSVWFLVWMSPMVAVICNAVMSMFSFVHGVCMGTSDQSALIRALKQFLIGLMFLFAVMYCSMSFTSLALGSTIMAFMGAAMSILVMWTFVEVGSEALVHMAAQTEFVKVLAQLWRSDWVRAIGVGAVNMFIPIYFTLNMMTQKVRVWRKRNNGHTGKYTEQVEWLVAEMEGWNWASILIKVALLAELYFTLNVGVTKVTYIFLSWFGGVLEAVDFAFVVVLVFAIGYCMFLLPPVPGVPVYVFSGIVLADQGRRTLGEPGSESGFIQGCIIAVIVGFVNKLCACCGQYAIGYCLGTSLKIQQLIHVDSVPTRAIEKILNRPGLNIGKVAVLIGGPDWPVSVTCGILNISVPQMLIGTTPIIIILSPCVLAGAFIARQGGGGEDSIFPMLANIFLLCMMVGQSTAALVAMLSVMKVVQQEGEELAKPQERHKEVEALTKAEAYSRGKYEEVTKWSNMTCCDKAILLTMVSCHLMAGFIFVMMASACFLPFSVDKSIEDDIEDGGLGGNPWSIVIHPVGSGALGLFCTAVVLHIVFCVTMNKRAKKAVAAGQPAQNAQQV